MFNKEGANRYLYMIIVCILTLRWLTAHLGALSLVKEQGEEELLRVSDTLIEH